MNVVEPYERKKPENTMCYAILWTVVEPDGMLMSIIDHQ